MFYLLLKFKLHLTKSINSYQYIRLPRDFSQLMPTYNFGKPTLKNVLRFLLFIVYYHRLVVVLNNGNAGFLPFSPLQAHLQPPPPRSSIRSAQLLQLMGLDLRRLPPFFRHPPSLHRSLPPFAPSPGCHSRPHRSLHGDFTIRSQ